jgi:hypothetical protein
MQQHEKSNPMPKKQYAIHKQEQEQCQVTLQDKKKIMK